VAAPELTIVGRVRRAHGIHGELVIEPLTDVPDAVFAAGRRVFAGTVDGDPAPDGRALVVEESRPFKGGGWIVAFDGIADRNEAERWRERYVLAPNELAGLVNRIAARELDPYSAANDLLRRAGLTAFAKDL